MPVPQDNQTLFNAKQKKTRFRSEEQVLRVNDRLERVANASGQKYFNPIAHKKLAQRPLDDLSQSPDTRRNEIDQDSSMSALKPANVFQEFE